MAKKKPGFEEAVNRIEEIVSLLESPATTLDKSVELYREGISLAALLNENLAAVEKQVTELRKNAEGIFEKVPFAQRDEPNE